MPQPKGFEPFMRLWVFRASYGRTFSGTNANVVFSETEADYNSNKDWYENNGFVIGDDYGEVQWLNARWFIMLQLQQIKSGNWYPV
jgi:hypothetical protein